MENKQHYFNIEIDYTTGDSFNSERIKTLLDIVVSDVDVAKENLKRIKLDNIEYLKDSSKYREIELLTDEGVIKIHPFWQGYFETLHGAMIISELRADMFFTT